MFVYSDVGERSVDTLVDKPETMGRPEFGERLKSLRKAKGWTLEQFGQRSGVAFSTISKAERGLIALTYDNIFKLSVALGMEMSELLAPNAPFEDRDTITVDCPETAQTIENDYYVMKMLCSSRATRRMMPVLATIKAHSISQFSEFISHPGEEFVYVLDGELTLQIEGRTPRILSLGECVYFDSGLGHAYLSTGDRDARLLVVCWHPTFSELHVGLDARLM